MADVTSPWTYERPRGCLPLVGIGVLFGAVLSFIAIILGTEGVGAFWAVVFLIITAASIPLGFWLAFARQGVTVDVKTGTVREYLTIIFTFRERFHVLPDFQTVSILREKVRNVDGLSYLYHVCLVSPSSVVEFATPPNYGTAREVAVPLSELTTLPLVDGQWPVKH